MNAQTPQYMETPHLDRQHCIAQAQQGMDKSPAEIAAATAEKLLMGVQDDAFKPYAMKAIATLKIGVAMSKQKQARHRAAVRI